MSTRIVTVYYEDATGEHPIHVTVTGNGREATIESDLDAVPDDEREHVEQWARDEFWAQERAAYLRSGAAERDGD